MENFSTLIENSKRAVRYWWLLLIIGIALFVVGILIFVYPTQSYLGMSLVFGWLMLFSGILEVVLSSANKHFITGRGWMLAGGIIEIILGIILIFTSRFRPPHSRFSSVSGSCCADSAPSVWAAT